jgi:hypothetical protein
MKYVGAFAVLLGCYNPQIDRCTIRCIAPEVCPDNMTCVSDGFCHVQGDVKVCGIDGGLNVALTVTPSGGGTGTVTADVDPTFSCASADVGTNACQLIVSAGTSVMLSEVADGQSVFNGWSDAGAACTGQTCAVDVPAPVNVGVDFEQAVQLTIDLDGSGDGTVMSTPSGLVSTQPIENICEDIQSNSSGQCTGTFAAGTMITLVAQQNNNDGSVFGGWEGSGVDPNATGAFCANPGLVQCTFMITATTRFGVLFN